MISGATKAVIPEQSQQAISESNESGKPLYKIERNLFGFDSAKIGGAMMRNWGLPQSLWEPIQYCVEPKMAEEYPLETAVVHIGSLLTRAGESEVDFDEGVFQVDPAAWDVTGLTAEQCLGLEKEADRQAEEIMGHLFG